MHHPSSVSPHSNHIVGSNHLPPSAGSVPPGAHGTPVGVVQPSPNPSVQNAGSGGGANSGNSRGSFAAALRNLAKQADVKDDEPGGGGGGGPGGGGGGPDRGAGDGRGNPASQMDVRRQVVDGRDLNDSRGGSMQDSRVRSADAARGGDPKKRSSPQPPEKVRTV